MSSLQFKAKFQAPDGTLFDTKQEVIEYLRKPAIIGALKVVTGDNAELTQWLYDNQETVEMAFETGTICRVTKSEKKQLEKALIALKAIEGFPGIKFLQEHSDAIAESFRWPSVKRMTDAEKEVAARNTLVAATEGREDLAKWIIEKKDQILVAYSAGKEKREVSQKATDALAEYRAKMAAEKAAKAAASGEAPQA